MNFIQNLDGEMLEDLFRGRMNDFFVTDNLSSLAMATKNPKVSIMMEMVTQDDVPRSVYYRETFVRIYHSDDGDATRAFCLALLFIIEFGNTIVIGGAGFMFLPKSAESAWFLSAEEKETIRLKKLRDFHLRGQQKFEKKWIREALLDPFVWLLGVAFFTSSVAIDGSGVFLPTINQGLG